MNNIIITVAELRFSLAPSNLNAIMTTLWNPRRLLDVDPDGPFTCVGTTQKGYRCRNSFFSNSDLMQASILLDRMARSDPQEAREHLKELAKLTLCPRWHRKPGYSQVESMRQEWWSIIISTYPVHRRTRQTTRTTATSATVSRNSRQVSSSSESSRPERSLLTPPPSPSPAPRLRAQPTPEIEARRSTVLPNPALRTPRTISSNRVDSAAQSRSSSNASASSVTQSTAEPAGLVTPPQSPRQETVRHRRDRSRAPSPATVPETINLSSATQSTRPASPERRPATPERPIQPSTPCSHSSRRKPLIDECPICDEEMHCLDDAVWCRAECGTNIHRRCFAPWRIACLDREVPITCVYCRAPWKHEWEE